MQTKDKIHKSTLEIIDIEYTINLIESIIEEETSEEFEQEKNNLLDTLEKLGEKITQQEEIQEEIQELKTNKLVEEFEKLDNKLNLGYDGEALYEEIQEYLQTITNKKNTLIKILEK